MGQAGIRPSINDIGSGGGAGGSIQLITTNIHGNGHFSVKGGDGSEGSGGGGSGGRMVVYFMQSFIAAAYPDQSYYWTGTFDLSGGDPGLTEEDEGYLTGNEG